MALAHGGQVEVAARRLGCRPDEILDLSTGVYPEPDPGGLAAHLLELAPVVRRYPDRDGEPARTVLARELGVPVERLLIAAGAQAIIEVVFAAGLCDRLALREPCYAEVRRCAERSGVEVLPWPAADALPPAGALPWITRPHSLTGARDPLPPVGAGVLDESYAERVERRALRLGDGWIRIGSLTKCFSMPGLRLGYAIASPDWVDRLRVFLPPWPAPTLALHLLPRLLPSWDARDQRVARARERLTDLLRRADFEVRSSSASFVLARPCGELPDFAGRRILVREFPEWESLRGWIRVGLPADSKEWARLEEALCPRE